MTFVDSHAVLKEIVEISVDASKRPFLVRTEEGSSQLRTVEP